MQVHIYDYFKCALRRLIGEGKKHFIRDTLNVKACFVNKYTHINAKYRNSLQNICTHKLHRVPNIWERFCVGVVGLEINTFI